MPKQFSKLQQIETKDPQGTKSEVFSKPWPHGLSEICDSTNAMEKSSRIPYQCAHNPFPCLKHLSVPVPNLLSSYLPLSSIQVMQ